MSEQEILNELKALGKKVDQLLSLMQSISTASQVKKSPKKPKPKLAPLTPDEIEKHQSKFKNLYERWLSGDEIGVQEQLDTFEVEELRRFSDANNLNVTSKMSKERVLHLIGARFREKKQLHHVRAPVTSES